MKFINIILRKILFSDNRRKVVKNIYWAVLGKMVGIANQLLVVIMVARYLGPEQFGLMNYVINYVVLFSVFATFGLDAIEVRELSKKEIDKNKVIGTAFLLRVVFSFLTILLILLTLFQFESDAYIFSMIMVFSLSLFGLSFNVIRNYFTSIILNEYVVKAEISRTVVCALIKIILLMFNCSLTWFVVASIFDFIFVGGGYLYTYCKKVGSIKAWSFESSIAKNLLLESFPLFLSGTVIIVYQKINLVMIRDMIDVEAVGQFSVANKLIELGVFVPIMISQTVTPLFIRLYQKNHKLYLERQQQFMDAIVWISIIIGGLYFLLSSPVIRVLYGNDYLAAIPILQIMSVKIIFLALLHGSGIFILAESLQKYVVFRNIFGLFVCLLGNYLLIPLMGIVGSAIASVLAVAFAGYFSNLMIAKYRHLLPSQTNSLFFGWYRIILWIYMNTKKLLLKN